MKKLNIPDYIVIPLAYTLSPLVYAMFWWSKHIDGVELKDGKRLYRYKSSGSVRFRKPRGIRYTFSKWEPYAYANYIGLRFRDPTL